MTVGVALNLTQALLINAVLDYMKKPETADQNSIGYGLIGAYALVYTGSAVSFEFDRLLEMTDCY